MRQFLASNSLAILSSIAIKNSQRESREEQGACVHQSSFFPGARGWLSPALVSYWENRKEVLGKDLYNILVQGQGNNICLAANSESIVNCRKF
jgi:hypothetical protein